MLQVQHACFNDFPDQCAGCPDYSETKTEPLSQYTWLAGMITMYPPHFVSKVVKECRRYHKRIVEYPQEQEAKQLWNNNKDKIKLASELSYRGKLSIYRWLLVFHENRWRHARMANDRRTRSHRQKNLKSVQTNSIWAEMLFPSKG